MATAPSIEELQLILSGRSFHGVPLELAGRAGGEYCPGPQLEFRRGRGGAVIA